MASGHVDLVGSDPRALVVGNWLALVRHLVASTGGTIEETARLVRFATGLHSGFLNGILRVDLASSADLAGDLLAIAVETASRFEPAEIPWRWLVGPGTRPTGVARLLPPTGLEAHGVLEMMVRDPAPLPDGPESTVVEFGVREVLDSRGLEDWLAVRRANLGLDDRTIEAWRIAHGRSGLGPGGPLRHFVGSFEDRPVAAATLFLDSDPAGPTAGIYHVDTVPDQRRRGFGRATTRAALEAAGAVGVDRAVLTATDLGRTVYESLGFRALGPVEIFRSPPRLASAGPTPHAEAMRATRAAAPAAEPTAPGDGARP